MMCHTRLHWKHALFFCCGVRLPNCSCLENKITEHDTRALLHPVHSYSSSFSSSSFSSSFSSSSPSFLTYSLPLTSSFLLLPYRHHAVQRVDSDHDLYRQQGRSKGPLPRLLSLLSALRRADAPHVYVCRVAKKNVSVNKVRERLEIRASAVLGERYTLTENNTLSEKG